MIISFIVPAILMIFIWNLSVKQYPSRFYDPSFIDYFFYKLPKHYNNPAILNINDLFNLILAVMVVIYMLLGFYSIIYSYRRLNRPGVSIEMRKLFIKKHALYVVCLIFLWLIQLLYNYFEFFNPKRII